MSAPTSSLVSLAQDVRTQLEQETSTLMQRPRPQDVEALRIKFLGRKGLITDLLESLRSASKEERPIAGKAINDLRQFADKTLTSLKSQAATWTVTQRLEEQALDVSLPVSGETQNGALHPVSLVRQKLLRVFSELGFTVYEGPEIETDFYNFKALNFPDHHPARDMQDTFHVAAPSGFILRTHTSNIQVHAMVQEKPPLRVIAPGRVFRCDSDITHTPMFHQIEGFVVDEGVSFAHMKGTISAFLQAIFGQGLKSRFRPSFFPFVEPGAEFDVQCSLCHGAGCRVCKQTGWLEMGGCGMIHPNVLQSAGIDAEKYSGFAFGFGIDRMAMNIYQLSDLRQLFEGDYRFLGQFPVYDSF